ncbi:hypothetical protein SDC9_186210 [bioreactor metagenome]|uniref:Uncharacterized protein n=1 Tax=bioreactor metagenome TaxID=1076179 RepID=A0A645HI46_9ZZZZ
MVKQLGQVFCRVLHSMLLRDVICRPFCRIGMVTSWQSDHKHEQQENGPAINNFDADCTDVHNDRFGKRYLHR